jgi:hypothetical protein
MQDIIPPKKRSIRDIPLPENKNRVVSDFEQPIRQPRPQPPVSRSFEEEREIVEEPVIRREVREIKRNFEQEPEVEESYEEERVSRAPRFSNKKTSNKKKIFFTALGLVLIFVIFLVSRESAKVYIYAKEVTQSSSVSIGLGYTPLEMTSEKTVSVKATGEEQVTEKAKGRITIYNEYEEEEQRLLKETRFEAPGGLIYRIPNSVVVPAMTKDASGNKVPGKLEVEVVADEVGEKYNVGPTRFTVPGFKDLPQYNSFYAVSERPIEGGFDGIRKVISETDREQAESSLKAQVKDELIRLAKEKTTDDNLVLADESMIVYEILGDKVDGNNVSVSARGTIKAASFNFKDFSSSIAKSLISISDTEVVTIKNIDELNISISKVEDSRVNVDISGSIQFLWHNDHEQLKEALSGADKNNLDEVVQSFPGIEKISAEVMPFWSGNIPEDISKIKVIDSKN